MPNKKEIDKETMFRKIMPSAGKHPPHAEQAAHPPAQQTAPTTYAPPPPAVQATAAPPQPVAPVEAIPMQPVLAAAPAAHEAPPAQQEVSTATLPNTESPYPINMAELVAEKHYARYQQRMDGCVCQRCRDDVLGITLNKVRPRYVASDRLNPAELSNREMITETVTALIQAMVTVKNNPHHNETDIMRQ